MVSKDSSIIGKNSNASKLVELVKKEHDLYKFYNVFDEIYNMIPNIVEINKNFSKEKNRFLFE